MGPAANSLDLVARLVGAIEDGDVAALRSLYASDVVVWANFDDRARDVEDSMAVIEWLLGATTDRRYEVHRRIEIEGGVLQQHVLHATTTSGKTFSMPACLVIRIADGLITRIDEYLDPKPVTAALG